MLKSNVNDIARKIRSKVKNRAVMGTISKDFENIFMKAFIHMAYNTPQWSGTTAASWNIGFYQSGLSQEVRDQGKRKNESEALSRGHSLAIQVAWKANKDKLKDIAMSQRTSDLFVSNHAPGAYTAEYGPVRPVNQPHGPLQEFEFEMYRQIAWVNGLNRDLLK